MKLSDIARKFDVEIEQWDGDDPEVNIIEESGNTLVGWYSTGPFIGTLHIEEGFCTYHNITEF